MSEMVESHTDWYLLKCGCETFLTDYPFVSCTKCGYINCGSSQELKKAKRLGYLIETVATGLNPVTAVELQKKHGINIQDHRLAYQSDVDWDETKLEMREVD